jgi:two-component system LytT family response regulator
LKNKEPNVIFLDINMPGISGVEVAEQLKVTSSLIIFSTAYDQYAVKAFEVEAFDYLVKPYGEERFFSVLERAKAHVQKIQQATFSEKFVELYKEYSQTLSPHLTEFIIKERGFERKIGIDKILYIEASGVYAVLHIKDGTELYRAALNLLEQQLPPNFIRVHRAFIVNTNYIASLKYLNNSTYRIVMQNEDMIISSRKYKETLSKIR